METIATLKLINWIAKSNPGEYAQLLDVAVTLDSSEAAQFRFIVSADDNGLSIQCRDLLLDGKEVKHHFPVMDIFHLSSIVIKTIVDSFDSDLHEFYSDVFFGPAERKEIPVNFD